MKYYTYFAKFLVIVLTIFIIFACSLYKYKIGPVSSDSTTIDFKVEDGDSYYSVANKLYENKLIKSAGWFKIYVKLFNPDTLKVGTYKLSPDMGVIKIIDVFTKSIAVYSSITFPEGLNMRGIAKVIEKNTQFKQDDVFNLLKDSNYIDSLIDNYWFLTDSIKNDKIYYPLEGYLFPDTYTFNMQETDIKLIFNSMLDNMDKKLSNYKTDIEKSGYSIHEIITMSSIVEKEAGNASDRSKVAGVFYNRMNKPGETLGSDVTSYYGAKMDDWSNGLGNAEYLCNGYNTRLNSKCPINGLPVGPISNPGIESIKASIYPTKTNALFFVADCNGVVYLSITYNEHVSTINKLKNAGNWCDN